MNNYKIGDLLTRIKNVVYLEDNVQYKRVTIKTKNQGVFLRDVEYGSEIGTKKQFLVQEGQFLLSKIDARNGAFGIVGEELDGAIITGNFWAYEINHELLNIEWFNMFVSTEEFISICDKSSSGTTNRKYLNEELFLEYVIKLPSLNEQERMLNKYQEIKNLFNLTSIEVLKQRDIVNQLLQSVIEDAIQGQFVSKNMNVEPASILLEKVIEGKNCLVKEKRIKKEKPLNEISEIEIPYKLPEGWEWVRLGDITSFVGGYAFKSQSYVEYSRNQVIRLGNVKNFSLIIEEKQVFVPDEVANKVETFKIKPRDILVTMTGTKGKRDYFFTCLVNEEDTKDRNLLLNQRVGCLRTIDPIIPKYLDLFLKSNIILNKIFETETGTANQGNIGTEAIRNLVIPLPPLEEQKYIVNKIDRLMSYLNELQKGIENARSQLENIMNTMLKEYFSQS